MQKTCWAITHKNMLIVAVLSPNWIPGDKFWYRVLTPTGSEFILVDPAKGTKLLHSIMINWLRHFQQQAEEHLRGQCYHFKLSVIRQMANRSFLMQIENNGTMICRQEQLTTDTTINNDHAKRAGWFQRQKYRSFIS